MPGQRGAQWPVQGGSSLPCAVLACERAAGRGVDPSESATYCPGQLLARIACSGLAGDAQLAYPWFQCASEGSPVNAPDVEVESQCSTADTAPDDAAVLGPGLTLRWPPTPPTPPPPSTAATAPPSSPATPVATLAAPGAPAVAGGAALMSIGSASHHLGTCRPCAFFLKEEGCKGGAACRWCHLCPAGEKKRRKKERHLAHRCAREQAAHLAAWQAHCMPQHNSWDRCNEAQPQRPAGHGCALSTILKETA